MQGPKEILVFLRAGFDELSIGQHHIRSNQAINGQAELACQVAMTASESEAGHTRCGNDASRNGQTKGMGGVINRTPRGASVHADTPCARFDMHPAHARQVDDQPLVATAEPRPAVPAPANGQQQIVLA